MLAPFVGTFAMSLRLLAALSHVQSSCFCFRESALASSALCPLVFVLLLHFVEVGLAFGFVLLGACCTLLFGCYLAGARLGTFATSLGSPSVLLALGLPQHCRSPSGPECVREFSAAAALPALSSPRLAQRLCLLAFGRSRSILCRTWVHVHSCRLVYLTWLFALRFCSSCFSFSLFLVTLIAFLVASTPFADFILTVPGDVVFFLWLAVCSQWSSAVVAPSELASRWSDHVFEFLRCAPRVDMVRWWSGFFVCL